MDNQLEDKLLFSHKDHISTMFYRVAHMCEVKQNALLKEYGVTHQQTQVLAFIYARRMGAVFQKDIEKAMYLKSSTVTETLNTLEKRGFIQRIPCNWDRRAKYLKCTQKAIDLHEVFWNSLVVIDEQITRGFKKEELRQLHSLLEKAYWNLEG